MQNSIWIQTNTPVLEAYVEFGSWPNPELLRSVHMNIAAFWAVRPNDIRPERITATKWRYTAYVGSKELQSYARLGQRTITVELG